MSQCNRNSRDGDRSGGEGRSDNAGGWGWWEAGMALGAAVVAGGLGYALLASDSSPTAATESPGAERRERNSFTSSANSQQPVAECPNDNKEMPSRPKVTNLNSMLDDIHERYIMLKREDFQLHYRVFCEVFRVLQRHMRAVDKYYERYASNIQFAGSHYDGLRIKKPDEFDMDIVIGVPVSIHEDPSRPADSDVVIEAKCPGFVQLRAGTQYQKIAVRDGADRLINSTAHLWLDAKNYILRSKFTDWFKSVGNKALNQFDNICGKPACFVDGRAYTIRESSSGPAWTIIIERSGFRLDVDLVPTLKVPESRWPVGKNYREIPSECRRGYWMVVPKPNKAGDTQQDAQRSWRLALQDQEKQLLKNTYQLRQVVRLIKKFRDAQDMSKIASYYIKTLFFWEIVQMKDQTFWQRNDLATLFKHMLRKFHEAMDKGIPYFWNKNNNLIEHLNDDIRKRYKNKIGEFLSVLGCNDYESVPRYILTREEYLEYQQKTNMA